MVPNLGLEVALSTYKPWAEGQCRKMSAAVASRREFRRKAVPKRPCRLVANQGKCKASNPVKLGYQDITSDMNLMGMGACSYDQVVFVDARDLKAVLSSDSSRYSCRRCCCYGPLAVLGCGSSRSLVAVLAVLLIAAELAIAVILSCSCSCCFCCCFQACCA